MIAVLAFTLCVAQQPLRHSTFHAPNSTIYVECPDVAAALDAYAQAPAARMLRDEAVQEAFAKISKALDVDVATLVESALLGYGVGAAESGHPLDALSLALRKVRSFSMSYAVQDRTPGETRRWIEQLTQAIAELDQIAQRVEESQSSHDGAAPASLEALALADELRADPWGHAYAYAATSGGFELLSLGRDGKRGGVGADADIAYDADIDQRIAAELKDRVGACAVLEFISDEAAASGFAWLSSQGEWTDTEFGGAPAWAVKTALSSVGPFSKAWAARSGAVVVLGLDGAHADQVLAPSNDASPSFDASKTWSEFDQLAGPPRGAPVLRGIFDSRSQFDEISRSGDPALGALRDVAATFGLENARFGWRMQLVGERFSNDIVSFRTSPDSLLQLIGRQPTPKEALAYAPSDAVGFFALNLDNDKLRAKVADALATNDGEDADGAAKLAAIEAQYEFSLDEDVCANLRGGAAGYLLPLTGIGLPSMGLIASVRDPAKLERGLRGLFLALGEAQGDSLAVRESKYRDAPMWTLSFKGAANDPQMAAFIPSPTFSIVKDRVIVTLTSLRAKKEIKRALGEDDASHPAALAEGTFPADAGFDGWMDWAATIDGLYGMARSAAAMFGGQIDLPIDMPALMTALPESSRVFTRFFEPTTFTVRSVGDSHVMRWDTSFGPETWLGFLGVGFGAASSFSADSGDEAFAIETDSEAATNDAQREFALDALRTLSSRITIFQLDQGRYPTSLEELSAPTTNYPRGFLDGVHVSTDPWGNAYRYALASDGASFRLWSLGSDGLDANGQGDDIPAP